MPEIPKAQYAAYCDLATYDAAILDVLVPSAVELRLLGPGCDEERARVAVGTTLLRLDVRQAEIAMAQYWASQRPSSGDPAVLTAWGRLQPPGLRGPEQWATMSAADRDAWKARVRAWVATKPRMPPPEPLWSRLGRWARWHADTLVAAGAAVLVVAAAAFATSRKQRLGGSMTAQLRAAGYVYDPEAKEWYNPAEERIPFPPRSEGE